MACLVFCTGLALLAAAPQGGKDQESIALALGHAYKANVAAFTRFQFTFTFIEGHPRNLDSAIAGAFDSAVRLDGRYLLRDRMARYEKVVAKLKDGTYPQREKSGDHQYKGGGRSFQVVYDGKKTLINVIFVNPTSGMLEHHPTIFVGEDEFARRVRFPLNLGIAAPNHHDLFVDIERATSLQRKLFTIRSVDTVALGGSDVVRIVLAAENGTRTYWVDVKKGAVPLRIHDSTQNGIETFVINERLTDTGTGWLPLKQTVFSSLDSRPLPATQLDITSYDVEHDPDASMFTVEIPQKIAVFDPANHALLPGRTSLDLRMLPPPGSSAYKKVEKPRPQQMPPVMPGEKTGSAPWALLWAAFGLTVAGLCLLLATRRKRA